MVFVVLALTKKEKKRMGSSIAIHLLLLCLSVASLLPLAAADPPYSLCPNSNSTNYAGNSSFQNNLKLLMDSLPSNASISKQNYASLGTNGTNRVYAQYFCLNYEDFQSCSNCVRLATGDITQLCPYDNEAIVWEEQCQLRYANWNFLGHLNVSGNLVKDNAKNVSNPDQFESVVNKTLSGLADQAAYNRSANMYATGEATSPDSNTIFALVQCTTDLSPGDCNTCLQVAIANASSHYYSRGVRVLSRSCYIRYELYGFYKGATDPDLAPSGQNQATDNSKHNRIWVIVIITVSSALLLLAVLGSLLYYQMTRKGVQKLKHGGSGHEVQLHSIGDPETIEYQHHNFRRKDSRLSARESAFMDLTSIHSATNNFSDSNLLGQGGFGPVYKGILNDGREVAVKRLSSCSEQGTEEFTNEVLLIMKLQHKNLVRLLGFCVDGEEKLLVYEFMPNNSLEVMLFDPRKRAQLNWSRRVNIINGIARGILYLHEDSRLRIIHRDLKPSNVLLDNDMNPKISDFGMARIFAGSEGEANTATIVGTYGYMAPEYAMEGLYSTKSDVFSFGVLLLEIITGTKSAEFHLSKRAPSLLAYAWKLWNEGNELELVDPLLGDSYWSDEFSRYVHIGLLCVQEDACDRPTMSSVVLMLKSETTTLPQPERPAFSLGRFTEDNDGNQNNNDHSVNAVTNSDAFPR